MGPLPRSTHQHEYILVFVDYFSRWVELFPIRKATALTVASLLRKEILTRWGVPDLILSDQGTQCVSAVFKEICTEWKLIQKTTTAYHPQTNMTKGVNRTLKQMIAAYVEDNHKKLDQYLGFPSIQLYRKPLECPQQNSTWEENYKDQWTKYCTVRISLLMRPLMTLLNIYLSCNQEQKHAAENTFTFTFSRRFYPKRLTVHSGYTFFVRYHFLVFFVKYQERQLRSYSKKRRESSFKDK